MVGDFNFPDINWSSLTGSTPSSNRFCEFVFDHNLVQNPTHEQGNLLDLAFTTDEDLVDHVTVNTARKPPVNTDHYMVSMEIQFNSSTPSSRSPVVVWDGLVSILLDEDWGLCYEQEDMETIWASIKIAVISAMDRFIPKVKPVACLVHT